VATATAPLAGGGEAAVLQATGYVTARREATVSAQITGTVTDVLIEEGDRVVAGQVLAHLDSTAQRAQLAQAQAQYRSAQATLGQTEVQLAQAERDLTRQQGLMARQLASQQALEDAQTRVATARAQVEIQRKQVELGSAAVQAAQVQFNYATVRAPFDGVVIAKSAQVGEIVSPFSAGGGFTRTGIGTIVDMDSLEIEVDVNETYIDRIVAGQGAQAVLDGYPSWTMPAHVIAIIPTADRGKATVKVRVALDVHDPRILPDMGVRVSFLQAARPAASAASAAAAALPGVLVPASALLQRDGQAAVFVLDGHRVRLVKVAPRGELGEMRQVEGIAAGAQVVIAPPAGLVDGAAVNTSEAGGKD
jgi:RND family efflux transporter MFP subunit